MPTRKTSLVCAAAAVACAFSFPIFLSSSYLSALAQNADTKTQSVPGFKEIRELFQEYYPKATTNSSDTSLHFDYKCKREVGYYSGHMVLAPQEGGILCDVTLKPGKYEGKDKDRLPSETQDGFHTDFVMAPYSKKGDQHLLVHLSYPPDLPVDFKERLKTAITTFNANESTEVEAAAIPAQIPTANAAAQTPVASAAAPAASAPTAAAVTVPAKPAPTPAATFGGAKLSKMTFPEGKFRIQLPGTPDTKYATIMGMREVDYEYPQGQGSFNVSYVIMPRTPPSQAVEPLFDRLTAIFVQQYGGTNVQQTPYQLKNFPGRQLILGGLKGKPGFGGLIHFHQVQNYIYVVGVLGKKEWIGSPIVGDFMNSFEFYTPDEQRTTADQLHKHVAEYEAARKRQEDQDKSNKFSNDVRKNLHGNAQSHGQGNYK